MIPTHRARAALLGAHAALLCLLPTCRAAAPPDASPEAAAQTPVADVVSVRAVGEPGAYRFEVGVRSPDTGCGQYADWWEVVGEDGGLIHRRVLLHSHVTEQPFVRSGGPVAVDASTIVWVRAHLHPAGYGGQAFRGSVEAGFQAADPPPTFAADLADQPPQPPPCAH